MFDIKKISLFVLLTSTLFGIELNEYIEVKGFGAIGASTTFDKDVEFVAYTTQQKGAKKGEINLFNNSNLGLQTTIKATNSLSFTTQGIFINNEPHSFDGKLEWAYLSYETPYDITLRAGQFRLPIFNSSELSSLGYARTWIRPALLFYGVTTYQYINGIDVLYNSYYKDIDFSIQLAYGNQKDNSPTNLNRPTFYLKSDDMKIIKFSASYGGFTGSLSLYHANNRYKITDPKHKELPPFIGSSETKMFAFEGAYSYQNFTIEGAYGRNKTDEKLIDGVDGYIGTYYQIDDIRPYFIYSMKKAKPKPFKVGDVVPYIPTKKSYSFGMRYDFALNIDLKIQLDFLKNSELIHTKRGDGDATGLTFALEFIF